MMLKVSRCPSSAHAVRSLARLSRNSQRGIVASLFEISKDLKKTASDHILEKPKHGRTYLVRLDGRLVHHRASAPGEPPAELTGDLRRSLFTKRHGSKELEFGAGDDKKVRYARALELGAPSRKLQPRPYLKRSIEENDKNIRERLEHYIKKSLEKGQMPKASDIIKQLHAVLPLHTGFFNQEVSIDVLTRQGSVATARTSEPHKLVTGHHVTIVGALTKTRIQSISSQGLCASATVAGPYDLTVGYNGEVTVEGANEPSYNGTFKLLGAYNRLSFQYKLTSVAPPTATGDIFLIENRPVNGYNGRKQITVVDAYTFTYDIIEEVPAETTGDITARFKPRITGSIDVGTAEKSYTKQLGDNYWLYVVLDTVSVNKDREVDTDVQGTLLSSGDRFRQRVIAPFDIYVFAPTVSEIDARKTRDNMEDIAVSLYKSLLGLILPTGLTEDPWSVVTLTGHGSEAYVDAYYIHRFSFEVTYDLTWCDTIGIPFNTAFRHIDLEIYEERDCEEITEISTSINLDDKPIS